MEKQLCVNVNNQKTFVVESIADDVVVLQVDGKFKTLKTSSFKRYYRLIKTEGKKIISSVEKTQQIKDNCGAWKRYYKPYERNLLPLWNATVEDNVLNAKSQDGKVLVRCYLTDQCIKIKQVKSNAKRYFKDFNRAKRHLLYDQDIKTTEYIGRIFDKWLRDNNINI